MYGSLKFWGAEGEDIAACMETNTASDAIRYLVEEASATYPLTESVNHIGIIVLNLDTWLRAELKSLLDALITCVQDRQKQVRRLRQAIEELTGSILRKMRESQAENRRTRILGILRFHTFS